MSTDNTHEGVRSSSLSNTIYQRLWVDRKTRVSIAASIFVFILLEVLMAGWVHFAFEGKYYGPFLASQKFGSTERELAAGLRPVVPFMQPHNGWDGQFYFRVATDPFGLTEAPQHLDLPAYRYQRIGVPGLAWAASKVLGYPITSPFVYHSIQIFLVALGFGFLVRWLLEQGLSPWFGLIWLGAGGTLYTLAYGQPDAAADGVFIISLYALWHRKLGLYCISTALLLLIREGYVVYAFPVFLLSLFRVLLWREEAPPAPKPEVRPQLSVGVPIRVVDSESRFSGIGFLTALPGIVLLAWTAYLYFHFGAETFSNTRPKEGFLDWPFGGLWYWLERQWEWPNAAEFRYKIFSAITIVVIFVLAVRHIGKSAAIACTIPYVAFMACLGTVIWWDQSGYFKSLGSVLIVGLFLLPFEKGLLLKFVLAANLVIGIEWNLIRSIVPAPFFSASAPLFLHQGVYPSHPFNDSMNDLRWSVPPLPDRAFNGALPDFRYEIRWPEDGKEISTEYQGIWRRFHRELVPLIIDVTNQSSQVWQSNPQLGHLAVNVHYLLLDSKGEKVLLDGRLPLVDPIPPGETRQLTLWLRVGKPGRYTLRLGMAQEGVHGIDLRQPGQGVTYHLRVR